MLKDIINGYRTTRDLSRKVIKRIAELNSEGYNGRYLPKFDYIYPLVREFQEKVESLYESAEKSKGFRLGYNIHKGLDDLFHPSRNESYGYVSIESIHRQRRMVIEFDEIMDGFTENLVQGTQELVDALPPDKRALFDKQEALSKGQILNIGGKQVYAVDMVNYKVDRLPTNINN